MSEPADKPETTASAGPDFPDGREMLARLRGRLTRHPGIRRLCLEHLTGFGRPFQPVLLGHPLTRAETGLAGEALTARWLAKHGRRILRRNHRGPFRGEVDIVARHGGVLTFVEVKTRTSADFGRPADAVDAEKRRLIQRGAQDWLRLLGRPRLPFRFDIAEVLLIPGRLPRVNVIENAFQMPDSSMAGR